MSFISDYANSCTEMEMLEVTERVVSNKVAHLSYEFDTVMREHAENLALIDEKLVTESATENDAFVLYEAEAEEVKKKSRGILGSIFHAIGQLFKKIKEFLFGKSDKIDESQLPDEIELPADPTKLMDEGNKVMGSLKGFIAGNKGKLAAIAGSAIAGIGAFVLGKDKVKGTVKNLEEYSDKFIEDSAEIEKSLEGVDATPEELAEAKKASAKLSQIGNHIMKILKAIPHMGSQEYKNIAADNKEAAKKEKEASKDEKKSAKNDKVNAAASADAEKTTAKIADIEAEIEELKSKKAIAEKAMKTPGFWKTLVDKNARDDKKAKARYEELKRMGRSKRKKEGFSSEFAELEMSIGKADRDHKKTVADCDKRIKELESQLVKANDRLEGDVESQVKTESAYDSLMNDIVDMF